MRQTLWCYSYLYIHINFIYPSNWCAFLVPHKEVTHPSHWSQTFFWVKSSVINHRSRLTCGTVPGFAPCVTFLLRSPACQMMVRPSSRPLGFCRDFVGHVSRLSSWVFPGSMGKPWEALLMEITRPLPRLRLVWMSELKATYCGLRNGRVHIWKWQTGTCYQLTWLVWYKDKKDDGSKGPCIVEGRGLLWFGGKIGLTWQCLKLEGWTL